MEPIYQCCMGEKKHKTYVTMALYPLGRDWLLTVLGGESHIGALALSDKKGTGEHYLQLPHHKESDVIMPMLRELQSLFKTELLIIGGIHYEGITVDEIRQVVSNCQLLTQKIREFLEKRIF